MLAGIVPSSRKRAVVIRTIVRTRLCGSTLLRARLIDAGLRDYWSSSLRASLRRRVRSSSGFFFGGCFAALPPAGCWGTTPVEISVSPSVFFGCVDGWLGAVVFVPLGAGVA